MLFPPVSMLWFSLFSYVHNTVLYKVIYLLLTRKLIEIPLDLYIKKIYDLTTFETRFRLNKHECTRKKCNNCKIICHSIVTLVLYQRQRSLIFYLSKTNPPESITVNIFAQFTSTCSLVSEVS